MLLLGVDAQMHQIKKRKERVGVDVEQNITIPFDLSLRQGIISFLIRNFSLPCEYRTFMILICIFERTIHPFIAVYKEFLPVCLTKIYLKVAKDVLECRLCTCFYRVRHLTEKRKHGFIKNFGNAYL